MSIRKREWTSPAGERKQAWLVDYRDAQGARRAKQFARKKEADTFAARATHEVEHGIHTPDSQSITVAKAAENWLAEARRNDLETSTLNAYDQHVRLHITPFLGKRRLSHLTKPMVEEFRNTLLDSGRSRSMAKRVLRSLSAIVNEAARMGYVAQNVCKGVTVKQSARDKAKVTPPTKEHMRALIEAAGNARPMDKPLLMTLLFAGLRASEVRALAWRNVDLKSARITIDQRADFQNVIGPPKSASGYRNIPIPPALVAELRAWKLRCPPCKLDLVFPSGEGTPIFHANLVLGFLEPVQIAAGVTQPKMRDGRLVRDDDGKPVFEGIYTLHCFRHAAASLWIERKVDAKRVQSWMGHHSIALTFDVYGHLFAAVQDETDVMLALEHAVLGALEQRAWAD